MDPKASVSQQILSIPTSAVLDNVQHQAALAGLRDSPATLKDSEMPRLPRATTVNHHNAVGGGTSAGGVDSRGEYFSSSRTGIQNPQTSTPNGVSPSYTTVAPIPSLSSVAPPQSRFNFSTVQQSSGNIQPAVLSQEAIMYLNNLTQQQTGAPPPDSTALDGSKDGSGDRREG